MDLESAILASLTATPQTTWEVSQARLKAQGLPLGAHGTAATLTCLGRLEREGKVLTSKNDNGASVWRLQSH